MSGVFQELLYFSLVPLFVFAFHLARRQSYHKHPTINLTVTAWVGLIVAIIVGGFLLIASGISNNYDQYQKTFNDSLPVIFGINYEFWALIAYVIIWLPIWFWAIADSKRRVAAAIAEGVATKQQSKGTTAKVAVIIFDGLYGVTSIISGMLFTGPFNMSLLQSTIFLIGVVLLVDSVLINRFQASKLRAYIIWSRIIMLVLMAVQTYMIPGVQSGGFLSFMAIWYGLSLIIYVQSRSTNSSITPEFQPTQVAPSPAPATPVPDLIQPSAAPQEQSPDLPNNSPR